MLEEDADEARSKEQSELTKSLQRFELAQKTKEKGNAFFKSLDFDSAAKAYLQAYKLCQFSFSFRSAHLEQEQISTLQLACLTNRALTLFKLDRHMDVVLTCTDALALDPDNEKALFRRGVARSKLGFLDDAEADLNEVLRLNVKNKDAKIALKECASLRKQEKSQTKSRPFEGIFRSSPDKTGISNLSIDDRNGLTPYGGLKNEGATCYLNSVLQTVFHLPAFRRAIYATPTATVKPGQRMPVVLALQRLFCRLQVEYRSLLQNIGLFCRI